MQRFRRRSATVRWAALGAAGLMLAACGSGAAGGHPTAHTPKPKPKPNAATVGRVTHFAAPPPVVIQKSMQYSATVKTSMGTFVIGLFTQQDFQAVNNFVFLAEHKFFNTDRIFRVLRPFVFQTGDPENTGLGGPGYKLPAELPITVPYGPGVVAYAHSAASNDYGSQFFVCTGSASTSLNSTPTYTEIGKVTSGMNVVLAIAAVPVTYNPILQETSEPVTPVVIESVTIQSQPAASS
jgi:cyclophilin family peptidyl-prolyl cis-trans isomerase